MIPAAVACGWIGWSGYALALPVAMVFPLLWAQSPSRLTAAAVSAGYFLAASRGLPQGVANFYTADLWPGLLLWLAASLGFVAVHAAVWKRQTLRGRPEEGREARGFPEAGRALRYLVAMVLMGLPPFGIVGWAHPLTGAGILFPGWGWWGVVAATAGLLALTTRIWPAAIIILTGFWLWSAATWTESSLPQGWKGVDLGLGQSLGRGTSFGRHRVLIATVRAEGKEGNRTVVLPESALGYWTPTVARLWQEELRGSGVTIIAGAAVIDAQGYDNVLVAISEDDTRIIYRERMPVPVSMWQPWLQWTGGSGGARAHLFANPVVGFDGTRIAPLICYEQLILWPVLQSMLHQPRIIVATGNGWWTSGTAIMAIQKASVTAWARLFGLPVVMAVNR